MSKGCVLDLKMRDKQGSVVTDYSRYGNDGAVSGGVVWTEKGMRFDGSTGYLDCGNDGRLNITNGFSIVGWINPTTFGDAHYKSNIISKEHGDTGFTLRVGLGKPTITIRSDTGAWITTASPTAISTNEFTYICGILLDSKLYIYVNGIEKAETNFPGSPVTNALDLHIGKIPSASSRYFDGTISDVRIYNYAIPLREIKALYNATRYKYND